MLTATIAGSPLNNCSTAAFTFSKLLGGVEISTDLPSTWTSSAPASMAASPTSSGSCLPGETTWTLIRAAASGRGEGAGEAAGGELQQAAPADGRCRGGDTRSWGRLRTDPGHDVTSLGLRCIARHSGIGDAILVPNFESRKEPIFRISLV